jgi:hypothetical protein
LTFRQICQQHDLAIRELQGIMMGVLVIQIDPTENCAFVVDTLSPRPRTCATNFVCERQFCPRKYTNCYVYILRRTKPRVEKLNTRVVSLSPTLAGRVSTL